MRISEILAFISSIIGSKPLIIAGDLVRQRILVEGISGNCWNVDLILLTRIEYKNELERLLDELAPKEIKAGTDRAKRVKAIFEIKELGRGGEKPSIQTYRNHMLRAYGMLSDLRNWPVPKFLVVPYKEETRGFSYDAYFKSIGVELIDFSSPGDREKLQSIIENLG